MSTTMHHQLINLGGRTVTRMVKVRSSWWEGMLFTRLGLAKVESRWLALRSVQNMDLLHKPAVWEEVK